MSPLKIVSTRSKTDFDLVLLASHRSRMISSGTPITIDRDNDKNPVVALREIADEGISPDDLREELVHSLQKYVEVDEPEADSVPLLAAGGERADADDKEVTPDRMTEEELLKGLEGLTPPGGTARAAGYRRESRPQSLSTRSSSNGPASPGHLRFCRRFAARNLAAFAPARDIPASRRAIGDALPED